MRFGYEEGDFNYSVGMQSNIKRRFLKKNIKMRFI
jgi:hypothetical protein